MRLSKVRIAEIEKSQEQARQDATIKRKRRTLTPEQRYVSPFPAMRWENDKREGDIFFDGYRYWSIRGIRIEPDITRVKQVSWTPEQWKERNEPAEEPVKV